MVLALAEAVQVALVVTLGTIITAVPAIYAAVQSRQANNAVNHRKKGEPSLVEMVVEIHERQGTLEAAFLHHLVHDHDKGVEV